ncbi:hypothetical protein TcasGA2_TC014243 [Tribolium castaneum]|uniref:Vps16 C-terminal domain-containing protein n=1 Tax=Tribolium castaneum TaxID=7070 RepID=D6W789_TRICA|nr:PREDICTED: spermatogenesis-defective protein 39 homolog [Tribolium castaneum]XP_008193507.1 PREDICTED: spermatogenesis-defective protein 39 homolog [Tribolium castaneum]EFA11528.2 hypothetical protein TcasGA2_TC014243 [Tribolium castaneum]|eukprot:XP_008193506.1 PREDICTED: spermatogenesis-defective protein 39 homolog [Tribolium castaneum]
MASNEDDFWNESSSSQQNFFDGDDEVTPEEDVFSGVSQPQAVLPIDALISKEDLKKLLDDMDYEEEQVGLSPEDAIKKMFCGRNVPLTPYKSLEDKLKLLDTAIDIADGDSILTVLLFMKKTLCPNIFYTQLAKRNIAVVQYANYLVDANDSEGLVELFLATRNISYMKQIYYLLAKDDLSRDSLLKKLQQFNVNHAHNFYSPEERWEIEENIAFLEFQIKHNLSSKSVIELLTNLYMTNDNSGLIDEFQKQFKIDSFQSDWVMMSVCCKLQNWDKLLTTFINKSVWVIKKRVLKSSIRPDLFVLAISRYKPPENILEQFIGCVSDASKRLALAEKLDVHTYVINYYVEQKDKMALLKYMERVEPESQAMYLLKSSLNNPVH